MGTDMSGVTLWIFRLFMWAFYALLVIRIVGTFAIETWAALSKRWRDRMVDDAADEPSPKELSRP